MTAILVFTGNAGPGIAQAAGATALHAAEAGHRTLLFSLGPAHSFGALLDASLSGDPSEVAPRLDALALDSLADLAAAWERGRGTMPAQLARVGGDELPLLPGLEAFFGLLRLRDLAPRYDRVVVDAGPHDLLLRTLGLPDGLRWAVRLLFGLDRGPGRSSASVGRALLPTSFIPTDTLDRVQEMRVEAERLRALLTASDSASARYVLRPDAPALEEARLAVAALQLHGLAVPALLAGPLLPGELAAARLAALAEHQATLLAEARALWPTRPLLRFDLGTVAHGLAALHETGRQLYGDQQDVVAPASAPIAERVAGAPGIAIDLPAVPKSALRLTLSGDEMIVQVGPYRRHILMPEGLRNTSGIKATRDGDRLIVRPR